MLVCTNKNFSHNYNAAREQQYTYRSLTSARFQHLSRSNLHTIEPLSHCIVTSYRRICITDTQSVAWKLQYIQKWLGYKTRRTLLPFGVDCGTVLKNNSMCGCTELRNKWNNPLARGTELAYRSKLKKNEAHEFKIKAETKVLKLSLRPKSEA